MSRLYKINANWLIKIACRMQILLLFTQLIHTLYSDTIEFNYNFRHLTHWLDYKASLAEEKIIMN